MKRPEPHLLLIESQPELRDATADLLAEMGFTVVSRARAGQAIELLRDPSGPRIGLVVANAYLEDLRGLELVRRLRQEDRRLPIVLISGFGATGEIAERARRREFGLLATPFSAQELNEAVRAAMEPEAQQPATPPRRVRSLHLAAAALAVIAVGISVRALTDSGPSLPEPPTTQVFRSGRLQTIAPNGELAQPPRVLQWEAVSGAARYRVRLRTVDNRILWEAERTTGSTRLPDALVQTLQPAVTYRWAVEALDSEEGLLAQSGEIRFHIRPDSRPQP